MTFQELARARYSVKERITEHRQQVGGDLPCQKSLHVFALHHPDGDRRCENADALRNIKRHIRIFSSTRTCSKLYSTKKANRLLTE